MNRNQTILLVAATVLLVGIYLFAKTKKPKDATADVAEQGHAMPEQQKDELNILGYIGQMNAQISDKNMHDSVVEYTRLSSFDKLIEEYKKLDKPLAVAYYVLKQAEKENTIEAYVRAGDYNSMLMQTAPDEKARRYLIGNAISAYKKAAETDASNTDVQIRLASALIEEGTQPMQGVSMLLEIVRKDSTNTDAQLMLARFGLISGQYDKAIARLEKIIYLRPQNSEALFLLAEAYNSQGNKDKAIEVLQKCKRTITNPELKKEVDLYIKNIKQPAAIKN